MAVISLNLSELYERTFGNKPEVTNYNFMPPSPEWAGNTAKKSGLRRETAMLGADYWAKDNFGREYYMPATISYYDTEQKQQVQFQLPYPILSFDGGWNIVKTPLTQRSGTFKQIVGLDDYKITIKGLIVNKDNAMPEQVMMDMKAVFEATGKKSLICPLTDVVLSNHPGGKWNVVIESWKFLETRGVVNTRGYEMTLVSDAVFNLVERT